MIERHVIAVIHAEHHGHDRGMLREEIAVEARGRVAGIAAIYGVTGNSGVAECDVQSGIAREDEVFHEAGVEPLRGDAVAVEGNTIAFVKHQLLTGGPGCESKEENEEQETFRHCGMELRWFWPTLAADEVSTRRGKR